MFERLSWFAAALLFSLFVWVAASLLEAGISPCSTKTAVVRASLSVLGPVSSTMTSAVCSCLLPSELLSIDGLALTTSIEGGSDRCKMDYYSSLFGYVAILYGDWLSIYSLVYVPARYGLGAT